MGLGTSKDKEWMKMHLALWKEIQEQSNFTLESVVKNNVWLYQHKRSWSRDSISLT